MPTRISVIRSVLSYQLQRTFGVDDDHYLTLRSAARTNSYRLGGISSRGAISVISVELS